MGKKVLLIGGTGLVGRAVKDSLSQEYHVTVTAGHHEVEGGYQLPAEDTDTLISILEKENPDIVISSMRGDFQAQYRFPDQIMENTRGTARRCWSINFPGS